MKTTKNTKQRTSSRSAIALRTAASLRLASSIAGDHIDSKVLDFVELLEGASGYDALIKSIDPSVRVGRFAAIEKKLKAALPDSKKSLVEEYEVLAIEDADTQKQAAYLIGLSMGMRIAGGTR